MKLFWKVFNVLFILILLSLTTKVQLTSVVTATDSLNKIKYEVINQNRLFTKEEQKKFDSIKKPDIPEKMSDEIKFMQRELEKSYKKAQEQANPRFKENEQLNEKMQAKIKTLFPEDKRKVGVPVKREGFDGETTLPIANAWSNSVYTFRFLWWWQTYPASNAIYGNSYWLSTGHHGANDIIIWEARLFDLTRIHGVNLIWAYAPKRYAIEYSRDGTHYKTLIDWRDAIQGGTSTWWQSLIPALKTANRCFPDRLTFDNPVFARKLRIIMKGPVNYYFGLYRVDIFIKNWTMMIKNTTEGKCSEDCWVVNTIAPYHGTPLKIADCVGTIGYTENRELFTLLYDTRLIHYNSGMCVVSGLSKDVHLEDCNYASNRHDGREKWNFWDDGRITPKYKADECVFKPLDSKSTDIGGEAIVESTSEIADGGHNANRVVDGNEGSYWASNPGDEIATLTLYFKKWESMDDMTILWKYEAEEYEIYAYTLENGWRLVLKVSGNKIKKNDLKLRRINARAVQIKMNKTKKKFLKLPIYAIVEVDISDGAFLLKRKPCNVVQAQAKQWILDDQWYYYIGNKPPYIQAYNELTKTYLQLRRRNRMVNLDFIHAQKAKTKAAQLADLMKKTKKLLSTLLDKIKLFKTEKYSLKNNQYDSLIINQKQEFFFPYLPKPEEDSLHVGSVFNNAGKDCWEIKKMLPFKKSGFYWIKPECSKKPLRVYCDFSADGLGTSIHIWKSELTTMNSPIQDEEINSPKDVQKLCAEIGLYPIEIHNRIIVTRITKYLQESGYNLSLPLGIPLGFDYGCLEGGCSMNYKSFSNNRSNEVNSLFPPPLEHVINYNRIVKYNTMGLGYGDSGRPIFFNLTEQKVGIMALICSTNEHAPPISDPTDASLLCSDILSGNAKIDGSAGSKIKVNCPAFCKEKSEHKIYGATNYADGSSVCRAAIHAGFIKDGVGGSVILVIGGVNQNYPSTVGNGIKSTLKPGKSLKSFSFEKFKRKCPIDFFKTEDQKKSSSEEKGGKNEEEEDDNDDPEISARVKVTALPGHPVKSHAFNSDTRGTKATYRQPMQRPTPYRGSHNSGINWNYFHHSIRSPSYRGHTSRVGGGWRGKGRGGIHIGGRGHGRGGIHIGGRGGGRGRGGFHIGGRGRGRGGIHIGGRGRGRGGIHIGGKGKGGFHIGGKGGVSGRFGRHFRGGGSRSISSRRSVGIARSVAGRVGGLAHGIAGHARAVGHASAGGSALNHMHSKIGHLKLASNPQSNPAKAKAAVVAAAKAKSDPCIMNTDIFLRKIIDFRNLDYNAFKHFKKFGEQMKVLLKAFKAEFAFSVFPSKLSNEILQKNFNKLVSISRYLQSLYEKVRAKSSERLKNTRETNENLRKKLSKNGQTKSFKFDYAKNIEDFFDFFSYKMSSNYPGKWQFISSVIDGRPNAVFQSSNITGTSSFGTLIILKEKVYYDFKIKVDVLTRSKGTFGVIFRMQDAFNYLAYEINIERGYKRIVLVLNGHTKVLKQENASLIKNDGGIPQNAWHKILITARRNRFKIRTGDARQHSDYESAPLVFSFSDVSFSTGKVALFTNGNNQFYFDKLNVESLICETFWKPAKNIRVKPDNANVFVEQFDKPFGTKYDVFSPKNFEHGPPSWDYVKNMFGREVLLRQKSNMLDKSEFGDTTKTIIKGLTVKKGSVLLYEFRAMHAGVVGCILKFVDNNNFYTFEVGGSSAISSRFFQIRRNFKGTWTTLKRISTNEEVPFLPFFGYDIDTWYSVEVVTQESEFTISIALLGITERMKIITVSDDKIPRGRVGFSTSGTAAVFGEIVLRPPPIPYTEQEIPDSIPQGELDKDILVKKFFQANDIIHVTSHGNKDKEKEKLKKILQVLDKPSKVSINKKVKTWNTCLKATTKALRKKFCETKLKDSKMAIEKCESNFCHTCCVKSIPKGHKISLFHCKKQCSTYSEKTKPKQQKQMWSSECIHNPNPLRNIYTYCDDKFVDDKLLQHNCKIDSCRLCCAIHDQPFRHVNPSLSSTNECFQECADKFPKLHRKIGE